MNTPKDVLNFWYDSSKQKTKANLLIETYLG